MQAWGIAGKPIPHSSFLIPNSSFSPTPFNLRRKAMKQFDSIEGLKNYLSGSPKNTPETAYAVKLDIGNTADFEELDVTLRTAEKYVSLDLSGSAVTEIPESAFFDDNRDKGSVFLIGITLPDSVMSIGKCAFYRCTSLERIALPDSLESIGEFAFYACSSLASIAIPDIRETARFT